METFKRFTDENYKNWLKTAESLYILRGHICEFVENETETYHRSLQERLKGEICEKKCTIKTNSPGKKLDLCHQCERWKGEILENHHMKGSVHWTNCQPHLWPTEKWEVAKAYMPRTPKDHRCFNQFDISAILNLMDHCKHFRTLFKSQFLNLVINVRNKVMHSPELRLSKANMEKCIEDVVKLSKALEPHAPGLKGISKQIQQFGEDLEKYCGQSSLHAEDSKEENLKLMNIEHQALKEKIEFLSQHYEDQQHAELKKELQGMKSFLEQNKDLLENLGPHVTQLDEIQEKVNKHDQQIDNLENRVDKLEKETQETMFIGAPLKFKNHLFEEAKKRKWPDPIFSEFSEANGYRGQVEVNGQIFKSSHVYNSKKDAHQEVAKKALDQMKACRDSTEDLAQSGRIDAASSSNALFYASATVVLKNQEVVSDGCAHEEDAVESAYKKLACLFGLNGDEEGSSFKEEVLAHFGRCHYPLPSEHLDQQDDKNFCKLLLCGLFTFRDKDGSTKKKQAEQQAAMVALQQLSGILNCSSDAVDGGNYIGFLKECFEAHGLKQPSYTTERKEAIGEEVEGPNTTGDNPHRGFASLQPEDSAALVQPPPTTHTVDDDVHLTGTHGTHTPPIPSKQAKMECTGYRGQVEVNGQIFKSSHVYNSKKDAHQEVAKKALDQMKACRDSTEDLAQSGRTDAASSSNALFYASATVVLKNQEVVSDGCAHEEDAVESAYKKLACLFGLNGDEEGSSFKEVVLANFGRCHYPLPSEHLDQQDDKNFCKLLLCGSFTFRGKDGSTKKKQAEQQAAMVALQQLSGILNCSSDAVDGGNYIGFLKECFDAHGLKQPSYTTERKEGIGEEVEGPNTTGDNPHRGFASLQPEDSAALVQPPPTTHTVDDDVHLTGTHGTHTPPIPSKQAKMECTEINTLLAMFNLKPPSVTIENVSNEEKFTITVEVNLDNLTIKNKDPYSSRKEAIRKAYYLLGCALGICQSSTDATMLVKQDFSQKSFPLPKEVIESKMEAFYCSLRVISYNVVYEGQGSTEADARRDGLQKVLCALPLLFGYESLPSSGSAEEMEAQITAILKCKGQKDLVYSLQRHQHRSSTKLLFKDYSMESTRQANKKANRSHLSRRILGLLGEKTEPNHSSVRNCLDEWFRKRDLQLPVYEDTAEPQGSRATFSVSLSCSNTDWADSLEAANEKLAKELSNRFRYLNDRDEY